MTTTRAFELPDDLLQRAVHASRGRTQQEVVIEALQEYVRYHEDEEQRAAAIEDGLALLTSADLDHPDRDSAWHSPVCSTPACGTGCTGHPPSLPRWPLCSATARSTTAT